MKKTTISDTLEEMIRYLYTDKVENSKSFMQLYIAADKVQLEQIHNSIFFPPINLT
jgi:hypothetical protein